MDELIFEEYKNLILKREKLRKDAQRFWVEYIKEFGELLEKEYSLKIECIKLKKMIAFCQARQNHGATVFRAELDAYLELTMEEYYDELAMLVEVINVKTTPIAYIDYYKIKKIYRKLAIMLHPDLNPALFEHEEITELWDRVSSAYENNDYEEMQALEILVAEAVKKYGQSEPKIVVENMDAKIALLRVEIDDIVHNDPYRYKELLRDEEAVSEKKLELQSTINEYEEYLTELKAEVEKFRVEEFAG